MLFCSIMWFPALDSAETWWKTVSGFLHIVLPNLAFLRLYAMPHSQSEMWVRYFRRFIHSLLLPDLTPFGIGQKRTSSRLTHCLPGIDHVRPYSPSDIARYARNSSKILLWVRLPLFVNRYSRKSMSFNPAESWWLQFATRHQLFRERSEAASPHFDKHSGSVSAPGIFVLTCCFSPFSGCKFPKTPYYSSLTLET